MTSRGSHGFTMIEVMIVLGIVAIVTGLAVAGGQSMVVNARATGEAEVIASFLRNTGLRAIATGCAHKVRYRGTAFTPSGTPPTAGTLQVYRAASCSLDSNGDGVAEAVLLHVAAGDWLASSYAVTPGVRVSIGGTDFSVDTTAGFIVGFQPDGSMIGGTDTSSGSAALTIGSIVVASGVGTANYTRTVVLRGGNNVVLR